MTVTTSGNTPRKFGDAQEAIESLRVGLQMGRADGLGIHDPGILTFAALRVTGPAGSVLVSAHDGLDGVVFYAPPVNEQPYQGTCEVIGTPDRITEVAGILRQRVTARRS